MVLDTGAAGAVFVDEVLVQEGGLAVQYLDTAQGRLGQCYLGPLRIGLLCLERPLGWIVQSRQEGPSDLRPIIVGLPALEGLSYLLLDNVRREAELSRQREFRPGPADSWETCPLVIRKDSRGFPMLLAEMPVAGGPIQVQLDTGSGRGLTVPQRLWDRIGPRLRHTDLREGSDLYPYLGNMPCKHGVAQGLGVGPITFDSCPISVVPNDSALLDAGQAMMGMSCFRDKVLVLDFRHQTLWIKDPHPNTGTAFDVL